MREIRDTNYSSHCPKRRLRVFYVRTKFGTMAVWAHSRERAEETAMDHVLEIAKGD